MERTKKREVKVAGVEPTEGQLLWIKIGGGSFRTKISGKDAIIKPGQKFFATKDEIPTAFRDCVECLSEESEIAKASKTPVISNKKTLRIILSEPSETNDSISEQIADLGEVDFDDEDDVNSLRESLTENGYSELSEVETDKLKDAVVKVLKDQYLYDIVDKKGKKLNEQPVSFTEAEKLVEALS